MTEEYNIDALYKYRDFSGDNSKYVERIFTHNEVYFSKPIDFNDPFDCRPKISLEANKNEIRAYIKNRYQPFEGSTHVYGLNISNCS